MRTIKAEREIIMLGDIELDVFMLPDGEYGMSQTQVTKCLKKANNSIIEFLGGKSSEALPFKGSILSKLPVEGSNKPISLVPIELAASYWAYWATKKNDEAIALTIACTIESIERRADERFGIRRTEEERNIKFTTRMDGILSRHFWTDTIDEYICTHQESCSDNYKRFVWIHVSDMLNKALFGMKSKQIREFYGLKSHLLVRDYLPSDTVRLVDTIEKGAASRVKNLDIEPKQAIREIIEFLGIEPDVTRLSQQ